jgi:hypothetical protein
MANEVYANNREISCKAGDGVSIARFPDVCFTPPQTAATPAGVPIPYPNTGYAKDTTRGSRTVSISGKEVMLKDKSYFKTSTGDEAGNAPKKAIVTSKIKGKVYFVSWSMNVKFEGQNVDRHLDLTTHNHASMPAQTPPGPTTDGVAQDSSCPHANLKRDPPKDEHEINQQVRIRRRKKLQQRNEKKLDRMLNKANKAGSPKEKQELFEAALIYDTLIKGERFEVKVAEQTQAKEVAVKITCRDCGLVIQEFDVVTREGVVKECKASWGQVGLTQFKREEQLAQRSDVFGPGTVVHIAIPKGQRGNLENKFGKENKPHMSGKIQEH